MTEWTSAVRLAAEEPAQIAIRNELAVFTADTFSRVGRQLHEIGYLFGSNRVEGTSPFGYGNDEIVGVPLLFRIAAELISASKDLFADGRHYAAAALVRQMVEIEYLAWAFNAREKDAERWLRSDAEERRDFFAPAKLRQAANGKFRGEDYGYHCELGGHPVPRAFVLLRNDIALSQIMLYDLLGHARRIWDHFLEWSANNEWAAPIHKRREEMCLQYTAWDKADKLTPLLAAATVGG